MKNNKTAVVGKFPYATAYLMIGWLLFDVALATTAWYGITWILGGD
jgi:hypothetical protein